MPFVMLCAFSLLLATELQYAVALTGQRWYNSFLLINPGLVNSVGTATSAFDCVNQCAATNGCSAMSFRFSSQTCLLSMCASLNAVRNTGWNTYILNEVVLEGRSNYPTPEFEYMLTDTCRLLATGNTSGAPSMTLSAGTSYSASATVYQGKAVRMNGSTFVSAYAVSSLFNLQFLNTGFTFSGAYYFEQSPFNTVLFNLIATSGSSTVNWGIELWCSTLQGFALGGSGISGTSPSSFAYSYAITLNTWYHFTLVYDPVSVTARVYNNGSLVTVFNLGNKYTSHLTWNTFEVAGRHFADSVTFPGRVYCVRFQMQVLSSELVKSLANSCYSGRVSFT